MTSRGAALQKRSGDPGKHRAEKEAVVHRCRNGGCLPAGLCQQLEGSGFSLCSTCEASWGVLRPVLGFPAQKTHEQTGVLEKAGAQNT